MGNFAKAIRTGMTTAVVRFSLSFGAVAEGLSPLVSLSYQTPR
jgi:hypothetical protein